jgi:hypothetical protein
MKSNDNVRLYEICNKIKLDNKIIIDISKDVNRDDILNYMINDIIYMGILHDGFNYKS